MNHVGDELPSVLAGELDLAQTVEILGHLRTCARCSEGLIDAVLAVAALRRAAASAPAPTPAATSAPAVPLPTTRRRPLLRTAVTGAAAVIVTGAILGGSMLARSGDQTAPGIRSTLQAVAPASGATGQVTMTAGAYERRMTISSDLPALPAGRYYEIWLLRSDTGKMVPVGILAVGGDGTQLVLPAALTESYTAVDVSVQVDDGDPRHGTSVLRASL